MCSAVDDVTCSSRARLFIVYLHVFTATKLCQLLRPLYIVLTTTLHIGYGVMLSFWRHSITHYVVEHISPSGHSNDPQCVAQHADGGHVVNLELSISCRWVQPPQPTHHPHPNCKQPRNTHAHSSDSRPLVFSPPRTARVKPSNSTVACLTRDCLLWSTLVYACVLSIAA